MSILTGPEIRKQVALGRIYIDPYDESMVNPNSVNVRLGSYLKAYSNQILDSRYKPETYVIRIPDKGILIEPGEAFLGHTIEAVGSDHYIPILDGRSTFGRMFLLVHATAGYGDIGFKRQWTLEMVALHKPVRVFAGMQIAQIRFETCIGEVELYKGRYATQRGPTEFVP